MFPVCVTVRASDPVLVTVARVSRSALSCRAALISIGQYWPPVFGGVLPCSLVFGPSVLWEQDVGGSNPLAPTNQCLIKCLFASQELVNLPR